MDDNKTSASEAALFVYATSNFNISDTLLPSFLFSDAHVFSGDWGPSCVRQACMGGSKWQSLRHPRLRPPFFVPSTGNSNKSTLDRVKQVMSNALVGHFDNEIDLVSSEGLDGKKSSTSCFRRLFLRPTVRFVPPYGRVHNLGCATGHHPFLMSCSSTNLVLVGLDLFGYWQETSAYRNEVYLLPKQLDVKVTSYTFSTRHGAQRFYSRTRPDYKCVCSGDVDLEFLDVFGNVAVQRLCTEHLSEFHAFST